MNFPWLTKILRSITGVDPHQVFKIEVTWQLEKWDKIEEPIHSNILRANPLYYGKPQLIITEPNLVVTAGLNQILKNFTAESHSGDPSGAYFATWSAAIGVGDSAVAAAAAQTDLQAATNKVRKNMNSGYPTAVSSASTQFQSDFIAGVAEFAWNEVGLFNNVSGGTMFSRKVQSFGTKSGGSGTWTMTGTVTASDAG